MRRPSDEGEQGAESSYRARWCPALRCVPLCSLLCPTVPAALLRTQAAREQHQALTSQEQNSRDRVYERIFDGCFAVVWS